MKKRRWMQILIASLILAMSAMAGCDEIGSKGDDGEEGVGEEGAGEEGAGEEGVGEVPIDVTDFRARNYYFQGETTLTNQELTFDETRVTWTRISLAVTTNAISLEGFDDPPLIYDDEPAMLRFRINGLVQERSPGEVMVAVNSIRPLMLDADAKSIGANTADELREGLEANGVVLPDPSDSEPLMMKFAIGAPDEEVSAISMTTDSDFFPRFDGEAQ